MAVVPDVQIRPSAGGARRARPPAARSGAPIRVASVPASHVYVRHLADPDGADGVRRLRDVPPADGATVPGGWWPPVMLDASWIREHAGTFDVFHVHFGFDAKTRGELDDVGRALREIGVPLVLTVHDLRNPHHEDHRLHDAQLTTLVEHAAAIVTLTPGAAAEIERRWGRAAQVVAHPHVVELDRLRSPRPRPAGFVVGMHAKSVRANMDVLGVATALVRITAELPGATLRLDLHDELLDPTNHWYAPDVAGELLALGHEHRHVEVHVHPYFTDDELWDYLEALDVSVLPYRFGTHSGWLEACLDLGTAVVAPDCGFYDEQGASATYRCGPSGPDEPSLRRAVVAARDARSARGDDAGARRRRAARRLRQRRAIAAAHRELYAGLL